VDILLPQEEYAKELKKCAGTWFAIPGVADRHDEYIWKILSLDNYDDQEYGADFILEMVFENYSRCLFIDTGVDGAEEAKRRTIEFANAHNLHHESRYGSMAGIYLSLVKAKTMAELSRKPE
jgi:hypothetical protein